MALAIQCYFESVFAETVQEIRKRSGTDYRVKPGFTLAVYETNDSDFLLKKIQAFCEIEVPPPVALHKIGFFQYVVKHGEPNSPFATVGFSDAMDYPKDLKLKLEDQRDYKGPRPVSIKILRLQPLLNFQKKFTDFIGSESLSLYYLPKEWLPHCIVETQSNDWNLNAEDYPLVGKETSIVSLGLIDTSSLKGLGEFVFK